MTTKILFVDDNVVNLKIYEHLAKRIPGCHAVAYTESSQALTWLQSNDVDLAVVDYLMPAINGMEFIRMMRGIAGKELVPVLMVTADHTKELRYAALESGADDFLTKPLDFTEFSIRTKHMLALTSARKRLHERAAEVQESEQRYRFLAQSMPQIVWTASADGNVNYYNQRWYDYAGMTYEETKGWGWEQVLHPEDLQNSIDRWTHCFNTGTDYQIEYRFRRASDGVYRWHLGRASPQRDEAGNILQWVGTCTDIDDNKRAEEGLLHVQAELETRVERRTAQLRQMNGTLQAEIAEKKLAEVRLEHHAHALMEKNKQIQRLFHTVSHELKTPLTSALEFVCLVRDELAGPISSTQREYLTIAKDGCDQLRMCIDDLLDASALDTGKLTVRRTLMAPGDAISRIVASLTPLAAAKQIEVRATVESGLPLVSMDEKRIRQVLTNFFNNALKFTPVNGKISVSVTLQGQGLTASVRVAVRDSGRGLTAEHASHVFERLYQVKRDSETPQEGLGLGLYICKGIIDMHDGIILVQSSPGQGSTFSFSLPVAKPLGA
ncbi:MAG: ATP-binding protein [Candidatus Eremiobacteraeota bacterium]|nr:ATP-binding protein [Candidatus Eremiobacteraeota bacterium]